MTEERMALVELLEKADDGDFLRAVAEAVGMIRSGRADKLVLAREVMVTAPSAHSPASLFGALRDAFSSCFCFCVCAECCGLGAVVAETHESRMKPSA